MAKAPAAAMTGTPVWMAAAPVDSGAPVAAFAAELACEARDWVSELRAPVTEELV